MSIIALAMIALVFVDSFETMILPRRVRHSFRLTRLYYQSAWFLWRRVALAMATVRWRTSFLSIFGPLSLIGLVVIWALGLILGFALLHWSIGTPLVSAGELDNGFNACFYFSATTFFTLGYGDVVPTDSLGRTLGVIEAGLGFGFLAMIISYLPILYQSFSRREIAISMLDARAGSPPTAGELLRRMGEGHALGDLAGLFAEWERWGAELLESHLSYPVLSFYRSQHDNQSWVAALTVILDTSALLIAGIDGCSGYQARLTFAMARHAAVDLGLVFQRPPLSLASDRLPAADLARLLQSLRDVGITVRDEAAAGKAIAELRALYEPFVNALADHFHFDLPRFLPDKSPIDNWQTSPWAAKSPNLGDLPTARSAEEHPH